MNIPGLPFFTGHEPLAVVPVLVGPLQVLMTMLPIILTALGGLLVALFKPSTIKRLLLLMWSQKLVLTILIAGVAGLVYAGSFIAGASRENVAKLETAKTDWPMWRGGLDRRAFVPSKAEDPAHDRVVWSFSTKNIKAFASSPTVVGNRVYATSARWLVFRRDGAIVCLDADEGKLVWKFDADKYRPTFSSPSISGKYLVVGEGLHETNDARVFCLDVEESERRREGVKLWEHRTKSHVEASPCIDGDLAFVGAGDDGMYCFMLKPLDDGNQVVWHLPGDKYRDCESSPACLDGKLYFTLGQAYRHGGENAQAVVCAEARTGKELWRIQTPYPVFGSPAVADGKLYVGMGHGDFIFTAQQVAKNLRAELESAKKSEAEIEKAVRDIRPVGAVWCIDLAKAGRGEPDAVVWKVEVGETVLGTPAVDAQSGRVFFVSRDGCVYSVSAADGKDLRKFDTHAPLTSSPAVAKDYVYAVNGANVLYGLRKGDLSPAWEVPLGQMVLSSPTVARGHVYLGVGNPATEEGGLFCIGRAGAEKQKALWAGALGGPGQSGRIDGSTIPARGQYAWGVQGGNPNDPNDQSSPAVSVPAAFARGALYVGENRKDVFGLARIRFAEKETDGKKAFAPGSGDYRREWFVSTTNPIALSPAVLEGAVFVVDGKSGDKGRLLRCLDAASGKEQWTHPVATGASGEFALVSARLVNASPDGRTQIVQQDRLYIADSDEGIAAMDVSEWSTAAPGRDESLEKSTKAQPGAAVLHAKKELFRAAIGPCVGCPMVVDDLVFAAVREPAALVVLDAHTGTTLWERPLPSAPLTGCVFTGGRVWVGVADGLRGEGLLPNCPTVVIACGPLAYPPVFDRERIALATQSGTILLLRPEDGREIARIEGAAGGIPPLLGENALLYAAKDSIQRYVYASGKSEQWVKLSASWPGRITSPMILVDSHLFFGTEKRGLVCMKPKE